MPFVAKEIGQEETPLGEPGAVPTARSISLPSSHRDRKEFTRKVVIHRAPSSYTSPTNLVSGLRMPCKLL